MTRYLDLNDVRRIVAQQSLPAALTGIADAIQEDFLRWPQFQKSARVANHSVGGVIELMPISDHRLYGFKYVNGHPKNTVRGLPTVMAFGVLADVETGMPLLLSEMTLTTALRTAATSALAARVLARPGAKTMALIGNGAQAEFQAIAFHTLLGIRELRVYDIDLDATRKLKRNLAGMTGLTIVQARSTAEAVRGADIVTTVTADKNYATILTPEMIEPGMHINGVGGDCPGKTELHPGVLQQASVFVEYEPQTRIEGDIQQMPAQFAVTELWQVLARAHPGRVSHSEVTVFDSVGFALEDYAALRWLHEAAELMGIGTLLDLVPQDGDPKDLYGALMQPVPDRRVAANADTVVPQRDTVTHAD